jgi:NADH-quinone oxidoreductase subunit G
MGLASAEAARSDAIYAGVRSGDISALFVLGADPVGDGHMSDRGQLGFLVVQELFLTETAQLADVVLPAQSWAEREGTYTSGERRVQRFYPAIPVIGDSRPDWQILAQIGERLGMGKPKFAASLVFKQIAAEVATYGEMDYRTLAQSEAQWPAVGRDDLYYGGTVYQNDTGVGQQWSAAAETGKVPAFTVPSVTPRSTDGLAFVQSRALYRPGALLAKSEVLAERVAAPEVWLHPSAATALAVTDGESVALRVDGRVHIAQARVNEDALPGVAVTRGIPYETAELQLEKMKEAA